MKLVPKNSSNGGRYPQTAEKKRKVFMAVHGEYALTDSSRKAPVKTGLFFGNSK